MRIDKELLSDICSYSEAQLADFGGATRDEIYRHIRLTKLIPSLLVAVDCGVLSIDAAVPLSFLCVENQCAVFLFFFVERHIPVDENLAQVLDEADELGIAFNDSTLPALVSRARRMRNEPF